jgi:hypothetical protein
MSKKRRDERGRDVLTKSALLNTLGVCRRADGWEPQASGRRSRERDAPRSGSSRGRGQSPGACAARASPPARRDHGGEGRRETYAAPSPGAIHRGVAVSEMVTEARSDTPPALAPADSCRCWVFQRAAVPSLVGHSLESSRRTPRRLGHRRVTGRPNGVGQVSTSARRECAMYEHCDRSAVARFLRDGIWASGKPLNSADARSPHCELDDTGKRIALPMAP